MRKPFPCGDSEASSVRGEATLRRSERGGVWLTHLQLLHLCEKSDEQSVRQSVNDSGRAKAMVRHFTLCLDQDSDDHAKGRLDECSLSKIAYPPVRTFQITEPETCAFGHVSRLLIQVQIPGLSQAATTPRIPEAHLYSTYAHANMIAESDNRSIAAWRDYW